MVAINKIESVERNRIKIAGQLIPVSDTYKDAFLQLINNRPWMAFYLADQNRQLADR